MINELFCQHHLLLSLIIFYMQKIQNALLYPFTLHFIFTICFIYSGFSVSLVMLVTLEISHLRKQNNNILFDSMILLRILWLVCGCFGFKIGLEMIVSDEEGKQQSPVNIDTNFVDYCPVNSWIEFFAPDVSYSYKQNGKNLQVQAEGSTHLTFSHYHTIKQKTERTLFSSVQFHFHSPSEHTINHHHYDLEIHIVHQQQLDQDQVSFPAPNHDLTVIGLLFYESDMEKDLIDWIRTKDNFNMYSLNTILDRQEFYSYKGSLTTPPYSENVNWLVIKAPLPIRGENLRNYKQNINDGNPNNRPVQNLNSRIISMVSKFPCKLP